jgi:uncharacterized protein (UPF0332 family)
MEQARERLMVAQEVIKSGHSAAAVSSAYYAMLNAARAALSEQDEHAKTHAGTWTLFSAAFVATGEFDQGLSALARRAKVAREKVITRPHRQPQRRRPNISREPRNSLPQSTA